jgi:hypothetical protein
VLFILFSIEIQDNCLYLCFIFFNCIIISSLVMICVSSSTLDPFCSIFVLQVILFFFEGILQVNFKIHIRFCILLNFQFIWLFSPSYFLIFFLPYFIARATRGYQLCASSLTNKDATLIQIERFLLEDMNAMPTKDDKQYQDKLFVINLCLHFYMYVFSFSSWI